MKRISKLVSLVLVVISMCLLLSCQSGGKKVVKLTSENWQDYLNIERGNITTGYEKTFMMEGDWFVVTPRNSDYVFEDIDAYIICTYDIKIRDYRTDDGQLHSFLQDVKSIRLKLELDDRAGNGGTKSITDVSPSISIDGKLINLRAVKGRAISSKVQFIYNMQIEKVEFNSGTVRKNELAD